MIDVKKYIYIIESDDLVINVKETKTTTVNQVNKYFDYIEELSKNNSFTIIIDLSDAAPPNAEIRYEIQNRFKPIKHLIKSYKIVVGTNFLIQIAAKFTMASFGLKKYEIYSNLEKAKETLIN